MLDEAHSPRKVENLQTQLAELEEELLRTREEGSRLERLTLDQRARAEEEEKQRLLAERDSFEQECRMKEKELQELKNSYETERFERIQLEEDAREEIINLEAELERAKQNWKKEEKLVEGGGRWEETTGKGNRRTR